MKKIGIIGGGAMGSGIAQVFAQSGHAVVLYDTNKEALDRSKQNLAKTFEKLVAKEKYTAEITETQKPIYIDKELTTWQNIQLYTGKITLGLLGLTILAFLIRFLITKKLL